MGTGRNERKTFLRISKGKVRQAAERNTPEAVEVEVKDDSGAVIRTKYEVQYDYIEGFITGIHIQASNKPEFADVLVIDMEDGPDHYAVQISTESSLANKLLNKLSNPAVDWTKMIKLLPYYFEDKHSSAIVVKQGETKIEPYFTMQEPRGCPVIPQKLLDENPRSSRTKNEIKKIMIDITAFIQDYFFANIGPNIKNGYRDRIQAVTGKPFEFAETTNESLEGSETVPPEPGDDLPF